MKWYAIYQNAAEVARQFHSCFGRTPLATGNILSLVRKFDETGSLEDTLRSGRPRSIATDENKERVLEAYEENPMMTQRRASLELNLSRSSLQRMMRELRLKPNRPQLLHALNEDDHNRRCEFASIFLNELAENSSLLDRIVS